MGGYSNENEAGYVGHDDLHGSDGGNRIFLIDLWNRWSRHRKSGNWRGSRICNRLCRAALFYTPFILLQRLSQITQNVGIQNEKTLYFD